MNTIAVNPTVYNWAETYAIKHHISLQELVEKALLMIVGHSKKQTFTLKTEDQLSPAIQSLIGIAQPSHADEDINGRDARMEYLEEKYGL